MQCRSNFVSIIKRKITQFKNWKMICTHSSAKVRCKWIKIWKYTQYHRYANENDTPHPYDSYNLKDSHKFWRWYGERIRRSWNTHALVAEHKIVQTLWKLIWQFLKCSRRVIIWLSKSFTRPLHQRNENKCTLLCEHSYTQMCIEALASWCMDKDNVI